MGDFFGGANVVADSFMSAFNTVDSAFARRRQSQQRDRQLDLVEKGQNQRADQFNRGFALRQTQDQRAAELHETNLEIIADKRQAEAAQRAAQSAFAEFQAAGGDPNAVSDEALSNLATAVYPDGKTRFNGVMQFEDGSFGLSVGGQRRDGSTFQSAPATQRGVPVAEGGEPIRFGSREELVNHLFAQAAPYDNQMSTYLEEQRDEQEQKAALGTAMNQFAGGGGLADRAAGVPGPGVQAPNTPTPGTQLLSPGEPGESVFAPGAERYKSIDSSSLSDYVAGDPGPKHPAVQSRIGPGPQSQQTQIPNQQPGDTDRVPEWFMSSTEMAEAGLNAQEAGAQKAKQTRWLEQHRGQGRAQMAEASRNTRRPVTQAWGAFADVQNPEGDELRMLAANDPAAFFERYRQDRNNINGVTARRAADQAVRPVVLGEIERTTQALTPFMTDDPATPINMESEEAKAGVARLKRLNAMQNEIYNDYSPAFQAGLFGDRVPVGNEELTTRTMAAMADAPGSSAGVSPDRVDAANAQARRFAERTAERPARVVPTTMVDAMHTLLQADLLTMEQVENVMRHGSLAAPTVHNLGGAGLYRVHPDGTMDALVNPQLTTGGRKTETAALKEQRAWAQAARENLGENWKVVERQLQGLFPEADENELASILTDFEIQLGRGGPGTMARYGVGTLSMSKMSPADLAQVTGQYSKFKREAQDKNAIAEWFRGTFGGGRFEDSNTMFDFEGQSENAGELGAGLPAVVGENVAYWMSLPDAGERIEQARRVMVGELGMPPQQVENMTPEQVLEFVAMQELESSATAARGR